MVFQKFVEIGRVCMINYGKDSGKLCTIINVVDGNRVLVDGPHSITGMGRKIVNIKRIDLTDIKIDIGVQAREKSLKKAFEAGDVLNKFKESSMSKRFERRKVRSEMNDFDRFKVMVARIQKGRAVRKKMHELRSK
mmetsp:Transcript_3274/g.5077  ORF Transcript_3274/g.5077 Transcript_3274/m.5077 type:complete len:136 (+) Transcript_3274:74-481(+)|eukprot:CAMPEP_0171463382 /NCGR_PEP_ID=MMETSP0945-20130129/7076_1 /TAXON_ID=109269 /ORGANISM="Vaucheria litorea, Strain CCMP2940" /LENGTH=135 /DNA_ID=CAMNT_0011990165 /DNA_START=72 /DNA_END=479 /DNA_ORIENTATION=-